LLGENEENLGVDALIAEAHARHGIPVEDARELVESSFEKGEALAQLIP
jgi:hypothetical protein